MDRLENTNPLPRFVADAMLGNVARDLRLLGLDTEYAGHRSDAEVLRLCQRQGRILLTRDCALARRAHPVEAVLVTAQVPAYQAIEVLRRLARRVPIRLPVLSRCLACNGRLRPVGRAAACQRLADHVALTHARLRECPQCSRVYWRGSHVERLERRARQLVEALQPTGGQV